MSASQKLLKLKQREAELKQEIQKLHSNLKTETAALMTDLLDYYAVLDVDPHTLIGAFSETITQLSTDKKSHASYKEGGKKLVQKIKRSKSNDIFKRTA